MQGDDETVTKGDKGTQVPGGIMYDDPVADSTDISYDTYSGPQGSDPEGIMGGEEVAKDGLLQKKI